MNFLSFSGTAETAVAVSEEPEKVFDFWGRWEFLFHFQDSIIQFQAGTENEAIGLFQAALYFWCNLISGKADAIEAHYTSRVAVYDNEGAYILYDLGHAAYHSTGTDFDELMNPTHAADDCMVFDSNMACYAGEGRHDDIVPKVAVMGYMGVGLQHVMGTDASFAVFASGTMNGHIFTNEVMVSDDHSAVFVFEFQILWVFADDSVRINVISFPHADILCDNSMGPDDAAFADFAVWPNEGISANGGILMNDRGGIDNSGRMDARFHRFNNF